MKTLSKYITELQLLEDEYGDLPLYTADDDEGNGYTAVCHSPSVFYTERAVHHLDSVEETDEDLGRPLIQILLLN